MDKGNGLQYNQAKERSESGNMDKGNGKEQQGDTQQELAQTLVSLLRSIGGTRLQYNQAKERSESGNMDKGNGKEQQGDTQQELAQTLVSLLRSIRGTRLQYNQAKERSESGNMDKGNGHMARDCPKVSDMKATNTPTSGGRGSRTVVGRGSMATFRHCLTHGGAKSGEGLQYNQAKERSESGNMDKGNGLQYNQAKERSESGNMDKGNGKEQQGDTQQELAQTLVSLLRSIGGTINAYEHKFAHLADTYILGNTVRAAVLYVSRGLM
ncbi:hypothetical protein HPP92_006476 [Vanilla planifolia]|uniref:Uncharacterized protein n=1 Tax=Vanilla planifolia TaxID=51239 RepID=A0A835RM51_VANPL|nr:hypothetical protein HPP92_006476 [Vanilla planifolia]